ncbi:MAG: type II toxin-antitoxin system VapC family toxin [Blastocatellia bacterium]|nr:type II toxin-antitoxin system VapC family toxin [Blastocatellia bacterium]
MLIDTSGFFALYSEKDKNHLRAKGLYQQSRLRITTNYILAEYVALALVRGLPRRDVLEFSEEILYDETVEIVWVDAPRHTKAVELLGQRPDKTYSLCDTVSFCLMRERRINEALTTDKHFVQEGFERLLDP